MLIFLAEGGVQFAQQRWQLVGVVLACLLFTVILTISFVRQAITAPLDRLSRGFRSGALGDVLHFFEGEEEPELRDLTDSFNQMARRQLSGIEELRRSNEQLAVSNALLIESQSFLAALVHHSPLAIIVTSPGGKIVLANRVAELVLGSSESEVIGTALDEHLVQDNERASAGAAPDPVAERIVRRQDGSTLPVFEVRTVLHSPQGDPAAHVHIWRDISESRQFQEMMIRLDRYYTRGEMAGDIAHDMNNYLAIVMGNLELLPMILRKNDPEKLAAKLDQMKSSVERIARFANSLMDQPTDEIRKEPCSVNQVVENVIAFVKPNKRFDTVHVHSILQSPLPLVLADPSQLQQLLVNLLYNAADAAKGAAEDPTITVRTSLTEESSVSSLLIEVSDNGPGVAPERVDQLFVGRFTTKRRGHGLGLQTCLKIAEGHGGSMSYRYADGAVFVLMLPVTLNQPNELSSPPSDVNKQAALMHEV